MNTPRLSSPGALLAAFFALLPALPAAPVSWSVSTVAGPSDVSTAGTLIGAVDFGSVGEPFQEFPVNGVPFGVDNGYAAWNWDFVTLRTSFSTRWFDYWESGSLGAGSEDYIGALESARYSDGGTRSGTVTLEGLTVGRLYQVQLWIVDTRTTDHPALPTRVRTVKGDEATATSTTAGGPNLATGLFVADAATQVITIAGTTGGNADPHGPQLNLFQIREVTPVAWTAATISGPADVSNAGWLVGAMNVGQSTPQTINGVTFAGDPGGEQIWLEHPVWVGLQFGYAGNADFWTGAHPGGNAAYGTALDSGRWGNPTDRGTIGFHGLTAGKTYLAQFWVADTRGCCDARPRSIAGGPSLLSGAGPHIATAVFTARQSTLDFDILDPTGTHGPQLNMFQLRDLDPITWTTATVTGPGDVSTAGALVGAVEIGNAAAKNINGVTFAGDSPLPTWVSFAGFDTGWHDLVVESSFGGSAAYAEALDTGWHSDANNSASITLKNLFPGRTYQVQLWIVDTRGSSLSNRRRSIAGGPALIAGGSGPNIATGTFTATGTTQTIAISGVPGGYGPQLNLLQLRDLTAYVTNNNDSGLGSLRHALANAATGEIISFAPSLSGGSIILQSQLDPGAGSANTVSVDASSLAAGLTLDGGGSATGSELRRIFNVPSGRTLHLTGLNITRGRAGSGGTDNDDGRGGAILNKGTLNLTRCTLSGNSSRWGGGAIFNGSGASLTMERCTLAENTARELNARGGAIRNAGQFTLRHCTVAENFADFASALDNAAGSTATLNNSIVVTEGAFLPVIINAGTLHYQNRNLVGPLSNSGTVTGTASTAATHLAPLNNYGGPTKTMALRPGSAALNSALGSSSFPDQRGFPQVGQADVGAYEAGTPSDVHAWLAETLPNTLAPALLVPAVDADGDGQTNGSEWMARTDPGHSASVLRITSIVRSGGNLVITFPSVTGRNYTLWQSDDLGTWTNSGAAAIPGNDSEQTFSPVIGAGVTRRCYRVKVEP